MGELINGRTAEEIKHVTEWACFSCGGLECDECEYRDACTIENRDRAVPDAYALIQHLESERDAALADMKGSRICVLCAHWEAGIIEPCMHCAFENNCFEWRGIKPLKEDE